MAVDVSGLKTDIKSLLDTANTTTASYDLSSNMSRRVQSVNTYNPERIRPAGNNLPTVCIWTDRKQVNLETINQSLARGKRRAVINFTVAGVVWVPYTTTNSTDPADTECEKLMENVEEVLRNSDTLGGKAKWHLPASIDYHSVPWDEQAHMRVGIMSLEVHVHY